MLCVICRSDIQRDIIKPVTKAMVGQYCCACFSDDNQWHRARVVAMVSTTHVSYMSMCKCFTLCLTLLTVAGEDLLCGLWEL